jgi:hypothetical protein
MPGKSGFDDRDDARFCDERRRKYMSYPDQASVRRKKIKKIFHKKQPDPHFLLDKFRFFSLT